MNDNLTKLLEQLANKLGTTAEYLWKVLTAQAYVSATKTLVFTIMAIVFWITMYKLHKKFSKNEYYSDSEGVIVGMIFGGIASVVLFFLTFDWISNTINGYFNPQYWALKEILDSI